MISILMPVYNGIEFINESVSSVLNQTYKDWELIIGINGHSENSEIYKIAKTFENSKIKVFDLVDIKGKSNALNKMLTFCKYDYIAILDVDDIWEVDKLEVQIPYIEKNYDVVGTKCIYFGDLNLSPYIPVGDISDFDFYSVNPIINSSSIIKKELCIWGGCEGDYNNDYNLWLKLRNEKKTFYNCDKILVKHRIYNNSFYNSQKDSTKTKKLIKYYKNIDINKC